MTMTVPTYMMTILFSHDCPRNADPTTPQITHVNASTTMNDATNLPLTPERRMIYLNVAQPCAGHNSADNTMLPRTPNCLTKTLTIHWSTGRHTRTHTISIKKGMAPKQQIIIKIAFNKRTFTVARTERRTDGNGKSLLGGRATNDTEH